MISQENKNNDEQNLDICKDNITKVVKIFPNKEEEKIVCDVCGYANPKYTAICKMCSNYLE